MVIERKRKLRLWCALISMMLLGVAIGIGSSVFFIRHRIFSVIEQGPAGVREVILKRLTSELDLSVEQVAQIEPVLKSAQERAIELRKQMQPSFFMIIDQFIVDIQKYLTPEQHERLLAFQKHWMKRFERFGVPQK